MSTIITRKPTKKAAIIKEYLAGETSVAIIANRVGCGSTLAGSTIRAYCAEKGIPDRRPRVNRVSISKPSFNNGDDEYAEDEYIEDMLLLETGT